MPCKAMWGILITSFPKKIIDSLKKIFNPSSWLFFIITTIIVWILPNICNGNFMPYLSGGYSK